MGFCFQYTYKHDQKAFRFFLAALPIGARGEETKVGVKEHRSLQPLENRFLMYDSPGHRKIGGQWPQQTHRLTLLPIPAL